MSSCFRTVSHYIEMIVSLFTIEVYDAPAFREGFFEVKYWPTEKYAKYYHANVDKRSWRSATENDIK